MCDVCVCVGGGGSEGTYRGNENDMMCDGCATVRVLASSLSLQVSLSCAYWLINRTGLPLIFKQEGTTSDAAAGQLEEHERASSTAPLLFSYSEGEFVEKLVSCFKL